MRLSERLNKLIDGVPKDSSIILTVETIEEWLGGNASGLEQDLTVEDVGKFFGRTGQTVRRWIRDGRLDAYHFQGREYRITESAIEEFQSKERLNGVDE